MLKETSAAYASLPHISKPESASVQRKFSSARPYVYMSELFKESIISSHLFLRFKEFSYPPSSTSEGHLRFHHEDISTVNVPYVPYYISMHRDGAIDSHMWPNGLH